VFFESGVAWKGCYGATGISGWNGDGRVEGKILPFLVLPNQSFDALGVLTAVYYLKSVC